MLSQQNLKAIAYALLTICLDCALWRAGAAADLSHELGKVKPKQLAEISGLAASKSNPQVVWVHNDGDSGQLFALSTTGQLVALATTPAKIDDLEDIAIGPGRATDADVLYMGDIGDNDERRREVRVISFSEPKLASSRGQQVVVDQFETYRLAYPDGPHDAEALLIDPTARELWIATKQRKGTRLYFARLDDLRDQRLTTLEFAGEARFDEVSGGDISRDGRQIILRSESQGRLWQRAPSESVAAAMARTPKALDVLGKRQSANGEAVSFAPSGQSYYTISEGKKQSLYEFMLPTGNSAATE